MGEFFSFLQNNLADFWTYTGFHNATTGHLVMILIGIFFIYLAVAKEFEPMLLIPIGFGMLIGNIPFNMEAGLKVGIYEEGSVLNILYQGVTSGWYPPLIFLGIGAMTDFSALISNPKLMLIGAAAQFGIFGAYMLALAFGFDPMQAAAIGIIGEWDIIPSHTLLDIVSRNALLIKLHLNSTGRIIYLRHYILQLLLIEQAESCIAQGILAHSTDCYRMQTMLTCVVSEVGRSTAELRTTRENIKEDFAQTYTIFCI